MPFVKINQGKDKGKYRSPSGRIFTQKQVNLYYETNGFQKSKMKKLKRLKKRKK